MPTIKENDVAVVLERDGKSVAIPVLPGIEHLLTTSTREMAGSKAGGRAGSIAAHYSSSAVAVNVAGTKARTRLSKSVIGSKNSARRLELELAHFD
jgi:hypothetical protein